MIRRLAIALVFAAGALHADASSEVFEVVASMAAGLAEDNVPAFTKPIDKALPELDRITTDLRAIIAQAEVTCSIERIQDEGDDNARTLVLDWSMRLKRRGSGQQVEQRREAVTLKLRRDGKKWTITSLGPLTFFAPPDFR